MASTDSEHAPPAAEGFFRSLGTGIIIGYGLGAVFYIACIVIAFTMQPRSEWWLNLLLCLFGGVSGWTLGTFLSPMTRAEEGKFAEYAKALSAFVTGFVLAKLDRVDFTHADTTLLIGRALLFAITFGAGFQFTFIARWKGRQEQRNTE